VKLPHIHSLHKWSVCVCSCVSPASCSSGTIHSQPYRFGKQSCQRPLRLLQCTIAPTKPESTLSVRSKPSRVEFASDNPLPILVVSILGWVQLQRSCDPCNTLLLLLLHFSCPNFCPELYISRLLHNHCKNASYQAKITPGHLCPSPSYMTY
jgi:hypothetical protein